MTSALDREVYSRVNLIYCQTLFDFLLRHMVHIHHILLDGGYLLLLCLHHLGVIIITTQEVLVT